MNLMLWTGAAFFRVSDIRQDGLELRIYYKMDWRHVPSRYSACEQKLPRTTRELTSLKNNKAKTTKKSKDSEKQYLEDEVTDNCECERLREKFVSLREEYQQQHVLAYDENRAKIKEAIKSDPKTFFWICRLKEKARWLPLGYAF
jgi:hypothetical protein